MEAFINEWGPVIEYNEETFKNYYLFHSGIANNNNFSLFYDNLLTQNVRSYNDLPSNNSRAKTQFLLHLTEAFQNYAIENNLKIVTYVGEASHWFDITLNTSKLKGKIVNKVGKLIKTMTAQGLLVPPTSTTIVQPTNPSAIQKKVAIHVTPKSKSRARSKRLKIADPIITIIPTIVPPNHSSTALNRSTTMSSLPTNIIIPQVTNNTIPPVLIPFRKPSYKSSSIPIDHHQTHEQYNINKKRIDDLEASVYSELNTIEANFQSFKENIKLLFTKARNALDPSMPPLESSPQDSSHAAERFEKSMDFPHASDDMSSDQDDSNSHEAPTTFHSSVSNDTHKVITVNNDTTSVSESQNIVSLENDI